MPLETTHIYTVCVIAEYESDTIICPMSHDHVTFLCAVKEYDQFKQVAEDIMQGMKTPELKCIGVHVIHRQTEVLPIVGRA